MKKILKASLIIAAFLALQSVVYAYQLDEAFRPSNSPFSTDETNPKGSLITILQIISGGLLYIAAPLAVVMLTFIGINMNIGGADSEKIEQGKKQLLWTIGGLFLIIISYTFVRIIITILVNAANG